jgi:acyl-coenzyme A synthetase/AMP-(fatty) acid ligase
VGILATLAERWQNETTPFLISAESSLRFADLASASCLDISAIKPGDVVAVVGDFTAPSIQTLLALIDRGAVVVPLTWDTKTSHDYFFESARVSWVAVPEETRLFRVGPFPEHELIQRLWAKGHAGLVLFSTGTTGRPKAILHDLSLFLQRFETPRPTLRTLNFLLFDHIGGINTLLHTLYNKGVVVAIQNRTVGAVLETCAKYAVEVLPTTPTFLRLMLISGMVPGHVPKSLKVITYGTERMDQPTLDALCDLLPWVDFRQTFGMSELGIVRVKSEVRNSLWMKIGGEGVETRVVEGVLQIRSSSRMLGYLNAESPFDSDGWYDTKDVVEQRGDLIKVVGRTTEVINVGGQKFMASEVERVALMFPGVSLVRAEGRNNPITGQHVELTVQPQPDCPVSRTDLEKFLREKLPSHMVPRRLRFETVSVGHRFKKA